MRTVLLGLAGLFLVLVSPHTHAQVVESGSHYMGRPIMVGAVPFCDTLDQAHRLMALQAEKNNPIAAAEAVSAEVNNPTACIVLYTGYIAGKTFGERLKTRDAEMHVESILVLMVHNGKGVEAVQPSRYFAVIVEQFTGI